MAEEQPTASTAPAASGEIVATAARDYRIKRFILVAVLLVYGLMCIRDGFYRYPRENDQAKAKGEENLPHPGFDVQFNQVLAVLLPPFAIAFLLWCLYNSRGAYRFDGQTLRVPGHPPVPLGAIRKIDRARWDRKGIAYIEYQLPGESKTGRLKLDDFIYQREPTDQIYEQITAAVLPAATATAAAPTQASTHPTA
jgi:hypothetical protein